MAARCYKTIHLNATWEDLGIDKKTLLKMKETVERKKKIDTVEQVETPKQVEKTKETKSPKTVEVVSSTISGKERIDLILKEAKTDVDKRNFTAACLKWKEVMKSKDGTRFQKGEAAYQLYISYKTGRGVDFDSEISKNYLYQAMEYGNKKAEEEFRYNWFDL